MLNGKRQIEFGRERLVREVNRAGRGQEEREEQEGQLALVLMVLVGGRASVRNRAETFGLERELMGRWENLEMRGGAGGPVRLVKGPAIIDDTVTARLQGDVSPLRTTGPAATPT
jgi:hypothetical protein